MVAYQFTPTHRIDIWGFTVHPLVIFAVPAIKVDSEEAMNHPLHCGHTDKSGLHQVYCFQLGAHLKAMVRTILERR